MATFTVQEPLKHAHLSIVPRRNNIAASRTENCVRLSSHGFDDAQFRIVIYQKQGGQQLLDLLVHYLQALTYDEIVLVANEDGDILEDTLLLKEIISKGVHVWQCIGTHLDKGDRWTQVIKQYQNATDFIQPVDVDEYLAILSPKNTSIIWTRQSLLTTLENLPPSNGNPYKTHDSKPVPLDCNPNEIGNQPNLLKHQAQHCSIAGFTKPTMGCNNKIFFRGKDFQKTDTGNHFGLPECFETCIKKGVEASFQPTNFVLLHYQTLNFQDWLVHALRIAHDENFNRLDLLDSEPCPDGSEPWQACPLFREFLALNFSLYDIRSRYHEMVCHLRADLDARGVTTLSC
eukprot:scaffold98809_cov31-Attheya_sp.AAC.1